MKLVLKYISMYLKSELEYKSSFIMTLISQLVTVSLSSFTVVILMDKFKFLNNYNIYEVIIAIAIVQFGFSLAETFARGFDKFSELIKNGTLDILLIRPRSIFMSVFGSNLEFTKISRVIASLILFIVGVVNLDYNISILGYLYMFSLLLFSALIYTSIFIFSACFCFKTIEGLEFMNIFTDGSKEFGQYPMDMFKKEVLLLFTFLVPLACVNFYPLKFILGKSNNIWFLISPLYTLIILVIAVLLFKKCIKNYEGAGS